jgi:hypothetical protein
MEKSERSVRQSDAEFEEEWILKMETTETGWE